jgi:flagellar biosynthetic protein FliR
MNFIADVATQYLADLMLPFMRLSGLFTAMVGFSARSVPVTVRGLFTIVLAAMIVPVIKPVPVENLVDLGTFVLAMKQLIIGLSIGFITSIVLETFVIAGQVVAIQTGLGFASIVDPVNGINVAAIGQFYLVLATLLFWSLDGHLHMIEMIAMSFEAFPIGEAWWGPEEFLAMAKWGAWMFIASLTLSLTPIVSLLVINLAFGVMTKAAPQLNVFTLGFSIAQIAGLLVIWITFDNFGQHFSAQWERATIFICQLLRICSA